MLYVCNVDWLNWGVFTAVFPARHPCAGTWFAGATPPISGSRARGSAISGRAAGQRQEDHMHMTAWAPACDLMRCVGRAKPRCSLDSMALLPGE